MEPTVIEPEVVSVPGVITGSAIIRDLCRRIADKLAQDCNLRESDSYNGYSAQVHIVLQLHDCSPLEVTANVAVGSIDPHLPSTFLDLAPEVAPTGPESSLERPVGDFPEPEPRWQPMRGVNGR